MKFTVLIENTAPPQLEEEWGLSLFIEYGGKRILLDTGASGAFAENADRLGIDLAAVDFGVLSHAHFDHSDGMDVFFERNERAPFYLREGTEEHCYSKSDEGMGYSGIAKGFLERFRSRIIYVAGAAQVTDGVWLLPHTAPGLEQVGLRSNMYIKQGDAFVADDLSHEQSLVFDTERGLVIFNSCSHAGADVIVAEAMEALPGRPVLAMIGGFHLFDTTAEEVKVMGEHLLALDVERIITGHCTGEASYDVLADVLGERLSYLGTGLEFEL